MWKDFKTGEEVVLSLTPLKTGSATLSSMSPNKDGVEP